MRKAMRNGPIRHEALINEQLDPKEIFDQFFANRPRPQFYSKCISSRHFDAAGTKTCQIMFRGRFNDIFQANEHYLALEPDFSNIDEVLAAFRDPVRRQQVTDAAYDAGPNQAHLCAADAAGLRSARGLQDQTVAAMCGIAGIFRKERGDQSAIEDCVTRMTATLAHRGPDASNIWAERAAGIAFGHRRLSVSGSHRRRRAADAQRLRALHGHIQWRNLQSSGYSFRTGDGGRTHRTGRGIPTPRHCSTPFDAGASRLRCSGSTECSRSRSGMRTTAD